MTDPELSLALNLHDEPWGGLRIIANMHPEQRASYERLVHLGDEMNLWSAGVGPKPLGVIVCREHKRRFR